jgi:hypothetical protein
VYFVKKVVGVFVRFRALTHSANSLMPHDILNESSALVLPSF